MISATAGPRSTRWSAIAIWLVFHDEHRVAFLAQPEQQRVHALDAVRVQSDRRLVENVGHVGER
jgi:hypothetical protein